MTIEAINDILQGTFESEADRQYWIDKRDDLIAKQESARNNQRYFEEMVKYNR